MKIKLLISIVSLLCVCSPAKAEEKLPTPSKSQLEWFDLERYAFAHFSLNTFTDQEWGFGDESPAIFNPDSLDLEQWAQVCSEAGLKGIIVTAKHHCGFCLWPSKFTEYSVKNSPWKDGKGDVIRDLRNACDKYGLKLGIYLSPWDRNHAQYGEQEYVEYFRNQLTELLTEYADIFEVWFDGANGGDGFYGGAYGNRNIDRETYYGWPTTVQLVRNLQPNCIIWNEVGPDVRWCGNEQGAGGSTNWCRYSYSKHVPGAPGNTTLSQGEIDGTDFVASEVNVSIRPGWFYHEFEDLKVKSLKKLFNIYLNSVGSGSTWLLNFPITPSGRIHQADAEAAISLNKYLAETFSHDLAEGAEVKKGDGEVTLTLKQPVTFNLVQLREDLATGQRIDTFTVEKLVKGEWQALAQGTTIGNKRIVRVPDTTADAVRVKVGSITEVVPIPQVSLFYAKEIIEDEVVETYDLDRSKWTIIEPQVEDAHLMLDGDKTTMTWIDKGFPVDVVIDMGETQNLKGFRYLPDQGDYWLRGIITNYEFAVSNDGKEWNTVSGGEFANIAHNPLWQVVKFKEPVDARYFRFRAIRNSKGWGDFGCAELDVFTK